MTLLYGHGKRFAMAKEASAEPPARAIEILCETGIVALPCMASAGTIRRARQDSRRAREQDIVSATRSLFDERGVQDAPIDEIARAVGINRCADLPPLLLQGAALRAHGHTLPAGSWHELLVEVGPRTPDPVAALREGISERFTGYCLEYPAFLDCALVAHAPPREGPAPQRGREAVWFRLGQDMASCLGPMVGHPGPGGREKGVSPRVGDPDFHRQPALHPGPGPAICTWPASASAPARSAPGSPACSRSRPSRCARRASRAPWRWWARRAECRRLAGRGPEPPRARQACIEDALSIVGAAQP